jgi:4-hydroxy-tetrahydrodipicolinate reductase
MSLRIALVGYGKMGQAVEAEAIARGHEICLKTDVETLQLAATLTPETCDCIIEFTNPESAIANFKLLTATGIPVVTGTTGWLADLEPLQQFIAANHGTFLYSSNFSIGVNVLFQLNKLLAKLMNGYPAYDCFIEEAHHRHKKDAPSGTAISLAQQLIEGLDRKTRVADADLRHRAPAPEELSVAYTRAGEIVGAHSVSYLSEIDQVTISHQAFNRRGFALGAVIAAEWIQGKQGFHEFSEVFQG